MNLQDWLIKAQEILEQADVFLGHGTDNYWDEALHLTLPLLGIAFDASRDVLMRELTADEKASLKAALLRRVELREPVPYITSQAWFCGMPFYVDKRVLIPRSPLGELIEHHFSPWLRQEPKRILDLCCGGACIALACSHYFPDALIDASDLSADALAVAAMNVKGFNAEAHVRLVQSNLFTALSGERYDLIVCNPPYVDAEDMAVLPPEYRHEPIMALESGNDGLDFTRRLLLEAADYLNDDGLLIVEVGNSAAALEAAFPSLPFVWLEFARGGDGVFLLSKADFS